jgi:hypothetical protein
MEQATPTPQHSNTLAIAGLTCLLVPASIWGLWIVVFSLQPARDQAGKVEVFLSFFPPFLRSVAMASDIVLIGAACAIVLSAIGRRRADSLFRPLSVFAIIAGVVLILLQLFTMM